MSSSNDQTFNHDVYSFENNTLDLQTFYLYVFTNSKKKNVFKKTNKQIFYECPANVMMINGNGRHICILFLT